MLELKNFCQSKWLIMQQLHWELSMVLNHFIAIHTEHPVPFLIISGALKMSHKHKLNLNLSWNSFYFYFFFFKVTFLVTVFWLMEINKHLLYLKEVFPFKVVLPFCVISIDSTPGITMNRIDYYSVLLLIFLLIFKKLWFLTIKKTTNEGFLFCKQF